VLASTFLHNPLSPQNDVHHFQPAPSLLVAGIVLTLLLAAVFTLGSLDTPFEPRNWRDVLTLMLSPRHHRRADGVRLDTFATLLRLWAERSREQLVLALKRKWSSAP